MKTTIPKMYVCALVLQFFLTSAFANELPSKPGGLNQVALLSDFGETNALAKAMEVSWRDAQGNAQSKTVRIVVVPGNGAICAGHAESRFAQVGGRLVGLRTLQGGLLALHCSTNKLSIPPNARTEEIDAAITNYLASADVPNIGSSPNDKQIKLRSLTGLGALMDLDRADLPSPPTITGLSFHGTSLAVSMKSSVGKEIVLMLDQQLEPVKVTVDGVATFDEAGKRPLTLPEELREKDRKRLGGH